MSDEIEDIQLVEEDLSRETLKAKLFVAAYLEEFNAAEAMRRVGYEGEYASQQGYEYLKKPYVQSELAKQSAELLSGIEVDKYRIYRELKRIATSDITDVIEQTYNGLEIRDLESLPAGTKSAIKEVTFTESSSVSATGSERSSKKVGVKMHDKVQALNTLAKITQLAGPDKVEVTGKDGGPIDYHVLSDEEFAALAPEERRRVVMDAIKASQCGGKKPPGA